MEIKLGKAEDDKFSLVHLLSVLVVPTGPCQLLNGPKMEAGQWGR